MIPRAIVTAVLFGAVFYVACITVQTLGFGTGPAGVSGFRHSQAPLGELARRYVGTPLAALLDLGAVLSALGAGLGGVTVAARMMFAFGRDGLASRRRQAGVRGDRRAAGAGGGDAHRPACSPPSGWPGPRR